jgi:hypothetical protein
MAMRLCTTGHTWALRTLPGPTAKARRVAGGVQLVESGLGSRRARIGPNHQNVSRWLVKDDLQMIAQSASSPGRGERFESGARQVLGVPEWDAGRELSYAACAKKGPSLGQDSLTMEPETTIRSRKRPVI